jgi:hypothetical protein
MMTAPLIADWYSVMDKVAALAAFEASWGKRFPTIASLWRRA